MTLPTTATQDLLAGVAAFRYGKTARLLEPVAVSGLSSEEDIALAALGVETDCGLAHYSQQGAFLAAYFCEMTNFTFALPPGVTLTCCSQVRGSLYVMRCTDF